eukprot:s1529_g16.t1
MATTCPQVFSGQDFQRQGQGEACRSHADANGITSATSATIVESSDDGPNVATNAQNVGDVIHATAGRIDFSICCVESKPATIGEDHQAEARAQQMLTQFVRAAQKEDNLSPEFQTLVHEEMKKDNKECSRNLHSEVSALDKAKDALIEIENARIHCAVQASEVAFNQQMQDATLSLRRAQRRFDTAKKRHDAISKDGESQVISDEEDEMDVKDEVELPKDENAQKIQDGLQNIVHNLMELSESAEKPEPKAKRPRKADEDGNGGERKRRCQIHMGDLLSTTSQWTRSTHESWIPHPQTEKECDIYHGWTAIPANAVRTHWTMNGHSFVVILKAPNTPDETTTQPEPEEEIPAYGREEEAEEEGQVEASDPEYDEEDLQGVTVFGLG